MDKTEFLDGLRQAGFRAVMMNGVPTVLSVDMSRDIPAVEKYVSSKNYHESFGIKKTLPESEDVMSTTTHLKVRGLRLPCSSL